MTLYQRAQAFGIVENTQKPARGTDEASNKSSSLCLMRTTMSELEAPRIEPPNDDQDSIISTSGGIGRLKLDILTTPPIHSRDPCKLCGEL